MNRATTLTRLLLAPLLGAALAAAFGASAADREPYWENVRTSMAIHDLATDGHIYVGGGGIISGGLWTSTDLTTWKPAQLPAGVGRHFGDIAYINGMFIAVSNTIITSSDGIHWSVADVPVKFPGGAAITQGNGLLLVASTNQDTLEAVVLTSGDGRTWTSHAIEPGSAGRSQLLNGAAWNGERFVITGIARSTDSVRTDLIYTSTDGSSWHAVTLPDDGAGAYNSAAPYGDRLAYGNGVFVAGGSVDKTDLEGSAFYRSSDGTHWTLEPLPNNFSASSVQFVNGYFVAVGRKQNGEIGGKTGYLVSTDGADWDFRTIDTSSANLRSAGIVHSGGNYILASESSVWTSADLDSWTPIFSGPQSNGLLCLGYSDKAGFVALGRPDGVLTSNDGRHWPDKLTPISSLIGVSNDADCITHGPAGFVAGQYYSADGNNWHAASVPAGHYLSMAAYNGRAFLGIDIEGFTDPAILTSKDGTAWTPTKSEPGDTFEPRGLIALNGRFFLLGRTLDGDPDQRDPWVVLMTSDPGSSTKAAEFTDVTPQTANGFLYPHIAYGNGIYVMMWTDADSNTRVAHSKDASTWIVADDAMSDHPDFAPTAITYGGGVFLAAGTSEKTRSGAFFVSHDAIHWTGSTYEPIDMFNAVVWDGTKFVATGSLDILNAPGVALDVTGSAPETAETGGDITYEFTVSNTGNNDANDVILTNTVPTAASFEKATVSQGQCASNAGGKLTCELGTIKGGSNATVTLTYTAGSENVDVANKASAYAYQPTRDDADSSSSSTVEVRNPEGTGGDPGPSPDSGSGGGAFGLLGFASLLGLALRRRMTSGA